VREDGRSGYTDPPVRTFLPPAYLRRFAAPGERLPLCWIYKPAIGEWKPAPLAPDGSDRHFNEADEEELRKADALDDRLEAVDPAVDALVARLLAERPVLDGAERALLADWAALMGVRLSSRFKRVSEDEARRGHEELRPVLLEMGWVFWEAVAPAYFITSSSPFHVAFPRADESHAAAHDLATRSVEITLPLSPRLVLHATWKRKGQLWKEAGQLALDEVNGRTMLRAARFLAAHKPAVPG
jgi:hypothetical protein